MHTLHQNHMKWQPPIPWSQQCAFTNELTHKWFNTKNWLTVTMMKYIKKGARFELAATKKKTYVDKMDCSRSCCCGCKLENVEARKSGGNVCWKRLKRLTIRLVVSSVASSVPLHKTCSRNPKTAFIYEFYSIWVKEMKNKMHIVINSSFDPRISYVAAIAVTAWNCHANSTQKVQDKLSQRTKLNQEHRNPSWCLCFPLGKGPHTII